MSLILKNGTVITFNEEKERVEVLDKACILIMDGRIAAIEKTMEQLPKDVADVEIVNVEGEIVSPGFVNTHVHSWQSVYRTMGPDTFLSQYFGWVSQMSPTATKQFKPDDVYISSLQGYLEGLHGGVTTFVEHAHNNWDRSVVRPGYAAAVDSGARVYWCYDVSPSTGFSEEEQWKMVKDISQERKSPLVQMGLSLDRTAPSASADKAETQELLSKAQDIGAEVFTIHHLGGTWPHGNSSPSALVKHGLHGSGIPIIFSHGPFLTDEEIRALREHDLFLSITPESECHYGHGQVAARRICDKACLGIDTNWTFSGDMLTQARLWLQTARNANYTDTLLAGKLPNRNPMAVEEAFLLATRQGGRALRRNDIGVLRVGAQADLVVFDGSSPNMLGWSDPVAAVILHANSGDVKHVLAGGQFRKRTFELVYESNHGQPTGQEIRDRFREAASRIQAAVRTPPPLPDKVWGVGELGDVEVISTRS